MYLNKISLTGFRDSVYILISLGFFPNNFQITKLKLSYKKESKADLSFTYNFKNNQESGIQRHI